MMPLPGPRSKRPARWPRRTARLRLTAIYTGLFLFSGAALITVTYALFLHATQYKQPHLPQIPNTPAIQALQIPSAKQPVSPAALAAGAGPLGEALYNVNLDQSQLAQAQQQLNTFSPQPGDDPLRMVLSGSQLSQLTQDQQKLTSDQRQLTAAVNQLAQAVHQVSQAGAVQSAQRATDSHELLVNSAIALGIVAALALLAGWLTAGRVLRPLRIITSTARRISSTNLHQRLALDGPPDELKQLGDTLDDLFGRLEAAFDAQRHFVANASHELRTPITAERNLLQVALDDPHTSTETWRETADELLASNDEQKNLIEALLALASGESGLDHHERTDLAEICETVLSRPDLDSHSLKLHLRTAILPAPVDGDPTLIERLVNNLVANAIAHNIPGGHVQVSTRTTNGKAVLTVTNTGPVIPPGEIDRLFQPFQRLDPRRTHHQCGHGLGLSIVQAIATTHHAAITTEAPIQGGLSLTVTFPRLDNPSDRPDATSPPKGLAAIPA
jgi:signal transduction histidine kinase